MCLVLQVLNNKLCTSTVLLNHIKTHALRYNMSLAIEFCADVGLMIQFVIVRAKHLSGIMSCHKLCHFHKLL